MKFSVVIPTFNRKDQVCQAIRSVLHQEYDGDFEVVVVDDGSTDGTKDHLFATGLWDDDRVKLYEHGENRGRIAAFNTGLKWATGDFVAFLDSDDVYHPMYLRTFAELIAANPDKKVFTCGSTINNLRTGSSRYRPAYRPKAGEPFRQGMIGSGSFVFARELQPVLPESGFPYGNDGSFSQLFQTEHPEVQDVVGRNAEGQWKPLGDPWGQDACQAYLLNRENDFVGTDCALLLQNLRG